MTDESILSRRSRSVGPSLRLSYQKPLHLVRGQAQYLFAADGRRFLDAYNNVAHVGHCHPAVVKAGQEQMAKLNTNTRYLHEALPHFAEKLTATLPSALRICYFVNSASEANELALRLARAHTGAKDLIVLDHAYHGNTTTLIDISPYKHNGPGGSGAPDWVHTAQLPDSFRGPYSYRDSTAAEKYAQSVRDALARLAKSGRKVCGFIAETCPSVGGQLFFPPGYLAKVYAAVRAAGGVVIADEVQTGYGRIGTHFWAFESQGVEPDIVVMGKAMGNGHPLAAVITTPAIARSFDNGMEYFSTFGGNPVSCAIGLAVLEVLEREGGPAQAQRVGADLLSGLCELAEKFPQIGQVRGSGFFIGVELVKEKGSREPAPELASQVANRFREEGILLGVDGYLHNVIKIRPPLPFDAANAAELLSLFKLVLGGK